MTRGASKLRHISNNMCVHSASHVGVARLLTRPLFITTSRLCQSTLHPSNHEPFTRRCFNIGNADPAIKQNRVNVSRLLVWSTMLQYWQNTTRSVLCQCWVALGYITENHYILTGSTVTACLYSVVILAKKSGQISNKGFMMYFGLYRSQLTFPKSPKQNSFSN